MDVSGTPRRALVAVRGVKVAAISGVAAVVLTLTLSHALAETPTDDGSASARVVERAAVDKRCKGAEGRAIVQDRRGVTKPVSFAYGWKVYQGKRPGTLLVVCPD